MGSFFQEWSDGIPNPQRINSQTWYHRVARTPCPACQKEYHPALDRQRYCGGCQAWYHVGCLGETSDIDFDRPLIAPPFDVEEVDADGFPAVWEEVLRRPTVRGHHGRYNYHNNWLVTGNGTQKHLIESWKADKNFPDDWVVLFGEDFLVDIMRKDFRLYPCPGCQAQV